MSSYASYQVAFKYSSKETIRLMIGFVHVHDSGMKSQKDFVFGKVFAPHYNKQSK